MAYRLLFFLLTFLLCEKEAAAQQARMPFPQHQPYAGTVIRPNHIPGKQMDDSVRFFYNSWKAHYVRQARPGEYYILSEHSTGNKISVSEGQGYGMMITVLMAGYDTAAHTIYDGMVRYFKSHSSDRSKYLMAWAQNGSFINVDGSSASDGDLDIAYSLLLASRQWGNTPIDYTMEAEVMIAAIMQQEINKVSFSVLLSNAVENDSKDFFDMRSSDFMPAHFKAFASATQDDRWNKVIDTNYRLFHLLQQHFSKEAGLVPDFIRHINTKPAPATGHYLESKHDGSYNYNACRVPWRIATDFIVNGDQRSKLFIQKINKWIRATTQGNPDNISAGYTLAGDDMKGRYFEAMSFIASFAVAAMVEEKNQVWLNRLWDYIVNFDVNQYDYYDNSIKMIAMILMSGNYWKP